MVISIVAQILFWISLAALFYIYVGYALFVYMIGRLREKAVLRADVEPSVSVIITAYNEEKNIRSKIENTLKIEYPSEKLEIIVASDGSNDETDSIVREYSHSGVKLFRKEGRAGKTATQNEAVETAKGDIILFSDATTIYPANVLRALLPNFADETVGCVAGRLVYVDDSNSGVGTGAKKYWSYETLIKEGESRACSLIGVSGCLYAVRRSGYVPMYPEACSDFLICTVMYRQGLRTVFEPGAVCTEQTNSRAGNEFQMRVRVISQTLGDLWRNRDMMNPFTSGFYGIQLISHKLLRYAAPLFLLLILLSSALLSVGSALFVGLLAIQVAFYLVALGAWALERKNIKLGLLAAPLYFVLANFSSTVAFYKFLRGERYVRWEPIR